jgi:hypothetical protein
MGGFSLSLSLWEGGKGWVGDEAGGAAINLFGLRWRSVTVSGASSERLALLASDSPGTRTIPDLLRGRAFTLSTRLSSTRSNVMVMNGCELKS